MEEHSLTTGNFTDDEIMYADLNAFLKAEKAGFPRPNHFEIGSMWWEKDGRHYIDNCNVERYVPHNAEKHLY